MEWTFNYTDQATTIWLALREMRDDLNRKRGTCVRLNEVVAAPERDATLIGLFHQTETAAPRREKLEAWWMTLYPRQTVVPSQPFSDDMTGIPNLGAFVPESRCGLETVITAFDLNLHYLIVVAVEVPIPVRFADADTIAASPVGVCCSFPLVLCLHPWRRLPDSSWASPLPRIVPAVPETLSGLAPSPSEAYLNCAAHATGVRLEVTAECQQGIG
jgi:hypothetical protein